LLLLLTLLLPLPDDDCFAVALSSCVVGVVVAAINAAAAGVYAD